MNSIQLILMVTTATSVSCECLQMHSVKGNKLSGHTFKRETGIDLMQCFQNCKAHGHCQSINFKVNESICEFNNRTREAKPSYFNAADEWVYFDNPYKKLLGSSKSSPGKSCKDIRDSAGTISLTNKEYWIDPANAFTPFMAYCDMITDGGGWTLIARTNITRNNEEIDSMIRESNYLQISNYSVNNLRIDVPAIGRLRKDMEFSQLRYFCHKKSVGRTFHIITRKNVEGKNVVNYFTEDQVGAQTNACESYFRVPGDNSVLALSCEKWGNDGKNVEIGKWGYFQHNGTFRIYNDPVYWNATNNKYFVNFLPERLSCDENPYNLTEMSAGDFWKLYVR